MKTTPCPVSGRTALLLVLAALFASVAKGQASAGQPKRFDTPQMAADALVKAAGMNDASALIGLFGERGEDLVSTGDPVQDRNYIAGFAAKAKETMTVTVDPRNSARAVLSVGEADWPLPVPIVKQKGKWSFDANAGREEVLRRRIGANELDAIQVCRGFVEAQWEYASSEHDASGIRQFAQRIISTPGKQDGLYWQNADGTPGGPISEAVARAIEEGYSPGVRSGYHGYYFKVLKGQGPNAPLGELDYVIKGIMIGGFALMAVPVEYGVTGVKSFLVSHSGIVYEKDLGPDSLSIGKATERFNPDKTWRRTDDEWPEDSGI